ncbi:MAG: glycosyltransferase family 2 protein [Desulfosporosinus sp.]|nr:glycosyltransferase family 2 protein [Desulfosporosinus sp.]
MNAEICYSIVIPVYNEEAVIDQTYRRLKQVLDSTKDPYELIFVNDGSCDHTTAKIKGFRAQDDAVKLITFSRNFGYQVAITVGMDYASGAAVVVIDADLQDPPEVILDTIAQWKEGFDVVYAILFSSYYTVSECYGMMKKERKRFKSSAKEHTVCGIEEAYI